MDDGRQDIVSAGMKVSEGGRLATETPWSSDPSSLSLEGNNMQPIPYTKGFFADAEGNIYGPDKRVRTQYKNKDGYKTASVLTDDNKWVTFGVQRLVALAYHPLEGNHLLMTVNHLDGDITNNTPTNLEWETTRNNVIHGVLLNRYSKRPLIYAEKKKQGFYFDDLYQIADYLKTDTDTIWRRIRDKVTYNGWKIRHLKSSDVDVFATITARPPHISERIRKLTMLDLVTKEEKHFNSINAAGDHFNVPGSRIRQRLSTPGYPKVFRGRYVFVDKGESFDFVTDEFLRHTQRTAPKKVIGYCLETGEFQEFDSATKLIKGLKLSKKAVHVRLKNDRLDQTDGWIVKYVANLEKDKTAILKVARPFE